MTRIVVYLLLGLLPYGVYALVPVEGILMGEAKEEIQQDPLAFIFKDIYDHSHDKENKKVKFYHNSFLSGSYLEESCDFYGALNYATPWKEKQARRSMAATLQYIGLDTAIKAVGTYARKLEMSETSYKQLTNNLVQNFCSRNLTIFSLRNIRESLAHYYQNPVVDLIPTVEASPFATPNFKASTETNEARSTEFDYAVKAFRSFCSWGGEVEDYRMMAPYLKNRYIMAFVIKNLLGIQDSFDERAQKVVAKESKATVQVICEDLICRKTSQELFAQNFPSSIGSTGLNTDLSKLYCGHFRYQDYSPSSTIPQVKKWIKESELEDPIFETNFFISLMTGVPDPLFGIDKYQEIPFIAKSSIDQRWNNWAQEVLGVFSKDLFFEESLKVRAIPRRDRALLQTEGFKLAFTVTLGEMDRIMDSTDKLSLNFNFKLSKNYIRSLRIKWGYLVGEVDIEGQKALKKEIASYLEIQLKQKEKYFLQKMWNPELARLMAEELLEQALAYRGPLFKSYEDQMLIVPVEFNYGLFALSYLRFRADVNADRLKFKL